MSENKNITKSLDNAIDVINAGGFEKGQMQAVVAKDSDWLIEKLESIHTDKKFLKARTTRSSHQEKSFFLINSYSPGLSELDPNFDGDEMERAICDLKHSKQFVPEIALSHLMKKHEMVVVSTPIVDKCSSAVLASKHGNNHAVVDPQNLYRNEYPFDISVDACFQKVPSIVEDVALCNGIHNATFGNQAEIVMTSDALRKRNPFRICLQKTPSGFVHGCVRGWAAMRINGLLKRKCKKGARKHYSKK